MTLRDVWLVVERPGMNPNLFSVIDAPLLIFILISTTLSWIFIVWIRILIPPFSLQFWLSCLFLFNGIIALHSSCILDVLKVKLNNQLATQYPLDTCSICVLPKFHLGLICPSFPSPFILRVTSVTASTITSLRNQSSYWRTSSTIFKAKHVWAQQYSHLNESQIWPFM